MTETDPNNSSESIENIYLSRKPFRVLYHLLRNSNESLWKTGLNFLLLAAIVALSVYAIAASPSGLHKTITVGPSGADYASIQKAVDAAKAGQTIDVRSGTYRENVKINKQITLQGVDTGSGMPVVDAGGEGSSLILAADKITVEKFHCTGSGKKLGDAGILVLSKGNTISNNVAYGNHEGIMLPRSDENTLVGNEASKNLHDGICLIGASRNTLRKNTAHSNKHAGIWLDSLKQKDAPERAEKNVLEENTANDNAVVGIALNTGADENEIKGNRTSGNGDAGILLNCGPMKNVVVENQIVKNPKAGLLLTMAGPGNRIELNQMRENGVGIEVLSSSGCIFTSNQVCNNAYYGIRAERMSPMQLVTNQCVFSMNNLIDNKIDAFDASGKSASIPPNMTAMKPEIVKMLSVANQWDNGKKGNHYGVFSKPEQGCVDANKDGIGDNPHPIPGGDAVDRFPLVAPVAEEK